MKATLTIRKGSKIPKRVDPDYGSAYSKRVLMYVGFVKSQGYAWTHGKYSYRSKQWLSDNLSGNIVVLAWFYIDDLPVFNANPEE